MQLRDYVRRLPDAASKRSFAERSGTTYHYLHQLMGSARKPSPDLARRLAAESGGQVSLAELRPDLWGAAPASRRRRRVAS